MFFASVRKQKKGNELRRFSMSQFVISVPKRLKRKKMNCAAVRGESGRMGPKCAGGYPTPGHFV